MTKFPLIAVLLSSAPVGAQPATVAIAEKYGCYGAGDKDLGPWKEVKYGPDAIETFQMNPALLNFQRSSLNGNTVDAAVIILRRLTQDSSSRLYGNFAVTGAAPLVDTMIAQAGNRAKLVYRSSSPHGMGASDEAYGPKASRYVARDRLEQMLDGEWQHVQTAMRGADRIPEDTTLFAQAATVRSGKDGSAWLGVRFRRPGESTPSTLIIHVALAGEDSYEQQLGIARLQANILNLIYENPQTPDKAVRLLTYGVGPGLGDLNYLALEGDLQNKFTLEDTSKALLAQDGTDILAFDGMGHPLNTSEAFYKKNLVVIPVDLPSFSDTGELKMTLSRIRQDLSDQEPVVEVIVEHDTEFLDQATGEWANKLEQILAFSRQENVSIILANPNRSIAMNSLWFRKASDLSQHLGSVGSLKIAGPGDRDVVNVVP